MNKTLSVLLFSCMALNAAEKSAYGRLQSIVTEAKQIEDEKARIKFFKETCKAHGLHDARSEEYREAFFALTNVKVIPTPKVVLTPEQIKRGNSAIKLRAAVFASIHPITNEADYQDLCTVAQEIRDRRALMGAIGRKSSFTLEAINLRFQQHFLAQQDSK